MLKTRNDIKRFIYSSLTVLRDSNDIVRDMKNCLGRFKINADVTLGDKGHLEIVIKTTKGEERFSYEITGFREQVAQ